MRNAVLILHGTGGTGAGFLSQTFGGELFGAGQMLDATRYFIILPDGIGHGKSTKPSDGLHARFPKYTYDDMVRAQHAMLVDGLKVNHLRLVLGTSMGAMHCWVWGEMYPDFVDGLVPLASAPTQIAGRNRIMRTMIMDSITRDPAYKNGDYTEQPHAGMVGAVNLLMMMTSSPIGWHKSAPTRDAADTWYENQLKSRVAANDANDMLYQFNASRDYDPSPNLEKITAHLLAINSADDVVNPPELGIMEKLMPRVKHGRYILLPTSEQTRGHGTHSLPAIWGTVPRRVHERARARPLRSRGWAGWGQWIDVRSENIASAAIRTRTNRAARKGRRRRVRRSRIARRDASCRMPPDRRRRT